MHIGHSDTNPFEVVGKVSDKCLEIRAMKATLIEKPKLVAAGGFLGHFDNSTQRWDIESDETQEIIRIRRRSNGDWFDKHQRRFILADEPRKIYDYNF